MTEERSNDEAPLIAASESVEAEVQYVVPPAAIETIVADDALDSASGLIPDLDSPPLHGAITGQLDALGTSLHSRLDALQTLFERELRAESTREKVVDRLHAELQEYKQDLLLNLLRPIFIDLIQLHDDIGKIVEAAPPAESEAVASGRYPDVLRGLRQGIEDILYRQGVEPFSREGEVFDPRRQRAVATVATDDPSRNKTVAARLRKGFQLARGDKLIRPEIVSVFTLKL